MLYAVSQAKYCIRCSLGFRLMKCLPCHDLTNDSLIKGRVEKRFLLELDGVTWALCHERTPFAELALATVVMDSIRYKDQSGEFPKVGQSCQVLLQLC